MKLEIVKILKDEGYIEGFEVREDEPQGTIHIRLKYRRRRRQDDHRAASGSAGRAGAIYRGKDEIPQVLERAGHHDHVHPQGRDDRAGLPAEAASAARCSATSGESSLHGDD